MSLGLLIQLTCCPIAAAPVAQDQEECDFDNPSVSLHRFETATGRCTHVTNTGSHDWLCAGLVDVAHPCRRLLGLQLDVDCLVYALDPGPIVQHISSLNGAHLLAFFFVPPLLSSRTVAFGYVQASKRVKKFVSFTADLTTALVVDARRYVYVYRQGPAGQTQGVQHIVDLDSDEESVGVEALPNGRLAVLTTDRLFIIRL